ncbi:hypothetical protein J1N35_028862 [Gossypium stocksii]|uniref:Uncharacterized protein n=1 Tax=Gossypium stocksii TaxID=47602 RepID=A0A9D3UX64_9ROSI|nr:hypothetical protein J1N35_028862 [Gossypium stocksii]
MKSICIWKTLNDELIHVLVRIDGYECGEIDKVDKSSLVCLNFQCPSHDTEGCPDWWKECYVPSPKSEAKGTSSAHGKTSTSHSSPTTCRVCTEGYECGEIDQVDKSSLVCLNFQCSSHDTEGCLDWWEEFYAPSPKSEAKGTSSAHGKTSTSRSSPTTCRGRGRVCANATTAMGVDGLTGASFTERRLQHCLCSSGSRVSQGVKGILKGYGSARKLSNLVRSEIFIKGVIDDCSQWHKKVNSRLSSKASIDAALGD